MRKILFFAAVILSSIQLQAQSHYWVMLTDKAGSTFDPYSYFDAKAIERYQLNNADLYDISNYPLNESYVSQIDAIASDDFGQSRWLNAVAVTATEEQIKAIQQLPFVKEVHMLGGEMQMASVTTTTKNIDDDPTDEELYSLMDQLIRMGGKYFRDKGIDGKGVRIAVLDGGFPQVNTHIAFKHLRDNKQIIKTWNFPNKKENVYGWNSHGLMTLSCIAGKHRYEGIDGEIIVDEGLATGAEFLLARTEIEAEPFKEEVWWQMAMEWADKNGAQIISSSLGYGKDRYYTKDMNGQSYVAKAGNMAARKGILVCNSAGNEGYDNSWRTIITPSDADSVLCVGGINNSLNYYEHINFSSYGPTADGRQKPNVVAFGNAHTANTGSDNNDYHYVDGTSFSCPLVAGFAACALQTKPGMTAMELFHEIEKSADLYPYCDYTYGYGVPQADYFTGDRKEAKPSFKFVKEEDVLKLIPLKDFPRGYLFIKSATPEGKIHDYTKIELKNITTNMWFEISGGEVITAQLDGYAESYILNDGEKMMVSGINMESSNYYEDEGFLYSTNLKEKNIIDERYFMLGVPVSTMSDELAPNFWSPTKRIGVRKTIYFAKWYGWGMSLEYGHSSLRFGGDANRLDTLIGMDDNVRWLDKKVSKHKVNLGEVGIELYQRVRLRPLGMFHKGWHWDLGVYGNWGHNAYKLKGKHSGDIASTRKEVVRNLDLLEDYRWNWGLTTRITRDWVGLYARYRMNGIGKEVGADKVLLPRLEVGLQLAF
ncbi:MAG: S8 family serine peptidase [Bacteroidales bacterium]|nr:S8 family serine peptidase [Bacteroidales bacterium]